MEDPVLFTLSTIIIMASILELTLWRLELKYLSEKEEDRDQLKMKYIIAKTQEEAQQPFRKDIIPLHKMTQQDAKNASDHAWVVVGCLNKKSGKWGYSFDRRDRITLYSPELEIRREPSDEELEEVAALLTSQNL